MAIKIWKWRSWWSKAKSGKDQNAEALVFAQDEGPAPLEGEASVPPEDEARVTDHDEVLVSTEDEAAGASHDGAPADDESSVPLEDAVPVRRSDAPRVVTHYDVRFIVVDEAAVASADEILDIGEAEAHIPAEGEASLDPVYEALVPLVDEALVPLVDEAFVPTEDTASSSAQDEVQVIVEHEAPVAALDEASVPTREVEKEEQKSGRRKHPRFVVKGGAKGRVASVWDAALLNISLGGALIEHANVVRPGTPSSVELDLQGKRIRLRCRVVRSEADRIEVQPDGEQELIYHTGLQFVDPSDETLQVIADYIHSLPSDG